MRSNENSLYPNKTDRRSRKTMTETEAETEIETDLPSYSPAAPIQTYLSESQQMLANKDVKAPIKNAPETKFNSSRPHQCQMSAQLSFNE